MPFWTLVNCSLDPIQRPEFQRKFKISAQMTKNSHFFCTNIRNEDHILNYHVQLLYCCNSFLWTRYKVSQNKVTNRRRRNRDQNWVLWLCVFFGPPVTSSYSPPLHPKTFIAKQDLCRGLENHQTTMNNHHLTKPILHSYLSWKISKYTRNVLTQYFSTWSLFFKCCFPLLRCKCGRFWP